MRSMVLFIAIITLVFSVTTEAAVIDLVSAVPEVEEAGIIDNLSVFAASGMTESGIIDYHSSFTDRGPEKAIRTVSITTETAIIEGRTGFTETNTDEEEEIRSMTELVVGETIEAGILGTITGWVTGEVLAYIISGILVVLGGFFGIMFRKITRTFKELGEFLAALGTALEDKKLTREEFALLVREGRDILAVWK